MQEIWKSVVGYEGFYEVSSLGRVRGIDRVTAHGNKYKGKIRRANFGAGGYLILTLYKNGEYENRTIHSLTLSAFSGECPAGMQACHSNGNRVDNRAENLRWDTPKENCADRSRHGTTAININPNYGDENGFSKLSSGDIPRILDLKKIGLIQKDIAAWFGVRQATISKVLLGRTWSHVDFRGLQ